MKRMLTAAATAAIMSVPFVAATTMGSAEAAGTRPVVLISGTASPASTVEPLAIKLRAQGRTVFPVALVNLGFSFTDTSTDSIAKFIDSVRAQTGSDTVDVVGWSQGAHVARRYVQTRGTAKVNTLVMLGSPTYEWSWMTYLQRYASPICANIGNCVDQAAESTVLHQMNDGADMPAGIRVVNIWSQYDQIVTPAGTVSRLKDGNTGLQFAVQDVCTDRKSGHMGLVLDPVAGRIVGEALQGRKATRAADCLLPPFVG